MFPARREQIEMLEYQLGIKLMRSWTNQNFNQNLKSDAKIEKWG